MYAARPLAGFLDDALWRLATSSTPTWPSGKTEFPHSVGAGLAELDADIVFFWELHSLSSTEPPQEGGLCMGRHWARAFGPCACDGLVTEKLVGRGLDPDLPLGRGLALWHFEC